MEGGCIVRLSIIRLFSTVHRLFDFSPLCIVWLSIIRGRLPLSHFCRLVISYFFLARHPERSGLSIKLTKVVECYTPKTIPSTMDAIPLKWGSRVSGRCTCMYANLRFKLRMVALFWSWWQKWMDKFRLKSSKTNIPGAWLSNNLIGSPQLTFDTRSTKSAWTNFGWKVVPHNQRGTVPDNHTSCVHFCQ